MVKSKVRFDGLDVAAMVSYLKCVALGRRVINIYNGPNGETYLFKLDKNNTNAVVATTTTTGATDSQDGTQDDGQSRAASSSEQDSNNDNIVQQQQQADVRNLMLLVESGLRFHTTEKPYENPGMPSPFCSKLRKHLRGLRLESVQQLGTRDRVVHFIFGSGEQQRHSIILELYARGNLILLNSKYEILALLRSHEYTASSNNDNDENNAGGVQVKVGHVYPVTYATTMSTTSVDPSTSSSTMTNTDDDANAPDADGGTQNAAMVSTLLSTSNPIEWYRQNMIASKGEEGQDADSSSNNNKKKKKKKGDGSGGGASGNILSMWRTLLLKGSSGVSHYGPSLLDHCILTAGFDQRKPEELTELEWKHVQTTLLSQGNMILNSLDDGTCKGYILYQPKHKSKQQEEESATGTESTPPLSSSTTFEDKLLLEFQPHLLKQHELSFLPASSNDAGDDNNNNDAIQRLEYNTFDRAVDEFFGHIEEQKRLIRAENLQQAAEQRLEKVKRDQQSRIQALLDQQEVLKEQAHVVEQNADVVDKAIQVVNSALDSGMDWEQLQDLVHVEQTQNQNPIALLIQKLDLENDSLILRLPTTTTANTTIDDYREGNERGQGEATTKKKDAMDIAISLKETAFGNASELFAKYRASKEKSQKTIEATTKALQAAEETAQRQLQEAQSRKAHLSQSIQGKRKPLWFEKFHWFVTSDNYLVIAGRDAQQNEQLVKRYLRPGDAYLHADVHGAASCILRAKRVRQQSVGNSHSNDGSGKTITLPLSEQALREAGNFTICKSSAWTSRMVTSAWWVESHQVSKTAPTGEYLTVGSFMIRGKKNFLPPSQLEMGLGVLFRLGDDDGIARHKNERRDFALLAELERQEQEGELDADGGGYEEQRLQQRVKEKSKTLSNTGIPVVQSPKSHLPAVAEESTEAAHQDVQSLLRQPEDNVDCDSTAGFAAPANDVTGKPNDDNTRSTDYTSNESGKADKASPSEVKKKGLSVKERKLIKKYGSLEAAAAAEGERRKADEQEDFSVASSSAESAFPEQSSNATRKRGKRGRMKKMMQKYKDQDEEDRELALLALHGGEKAKGSGKKKAPVTTETERKAAEETLALLKKDSAKVAESLPEKARAILEEIVKVKSANSPDETVVRWDKFDADVLEQLHSLEKDEEKVAAAQRLLNLKLSTRVDNFSASLAGIIRTVRKYGHESINDTIGGDEDGKRKTKKEKEAQESAWKQTLAEEGVVDESVDEDAIDDTVELGKLTGKPHPDDLILNAVPVCAPYQTLSQYAYRVKLTPGNLKRGKAAKQCVDMFLKDGQKSPAIDRNRDLIKKVGDNEWVQAICADVKISAAGASKIVKKQKANNKSKKKK